MIAAWALFGMAVAVTGFVAAGRTDWRWDLLAGVGFVAVAAGSDGMWRILFAMIGGGWVVWAMVDHQDDVLCQDPRHDW